MAVDQAKYARWASDAQRRRDAEELEARLAAEERRRDALLMVTAPDGSRRIAQTYDDAVDIRAGRNYRPGYWSPY